MKIPQLRVSNVYNSAINSTKPKANPFEGNPSSNVKFAKAWANYSLAFRGMGACWAVNSKGEATRFNSTAEASEELGVDKYVISCCTNGSRISSKDYAFCKAKELDNIEVGTKEYQEKLHELTRKARSAKRYLRCLVIDKEGNIKEFESFKEARAALGIDKYYLGNQLRHSNGTQIGDYTFYQAYLFEGVEANSEEFDEIRSRFIPKAPRQNTNNAPCIAVGKDGSVHHFESYKQASDELGLGAQGISKRIKEGTSTMGDYAFCRADEFDGIEPDSREYKEKIEKLRSKITQDDGINSCIAVDIKGNILHFNSLKEAENALGIKVCNIHKSINGKLDTIEGYTFCSGDEFEGLEKNSKEYKDKIQELQEKVENDAKQKGCIAVDKDGNFSWHSSFRVACRELALETELGLTRVGNSLAGRQPVVGGWAFTSAAKLKDVDTESEEFKEKIEELRRLAQGKN